MIHSSWEASVGGYSVFWIMTLTAVSEVNSNLFRCQTVIKPVTWINNLLSMLLKLNISSVSWLVDLNILHNKQKSHFFNKIVSDLEGSK